MNMVEQVEHQHDCNINSNIISNTIHPAEISRQPEPIVQRRQLLAGSGRIRMPLRRHMFQRNKVHKDHIRPWLQYLQYSNSIPIVFPYVVSTLWNLGTIIDNGRPRNFVHGPISSLGLRDVIQDQHFVGCNERIWFVVVGTRHCNQHNLIRCRISICVLKVFKAL